MNLNIDSSNRMRPNENMLRLGNHRRSSVAHDDARLPVLVHSFVYSFI